MNQRGRMAEGEPMTDTGELFAFLKAVLPEGKRMGLFAEAWGAEPARIVIGILHSRAPDSANKRAIDEAWQGWRAFHRDAWLTPAEADAKLEALAWALDLYDAGRMSKATGLIVT